MRRSILLFLVVVGLVGLPACERTNVTGLVQGFVSNTERLSREFVYKATEEDSESFEVVGKVEDAFRYQELVRQAGSDVGELVVDDDVLAVRVIDPSKVPGLASGFAPLPQIVVRALTAGQWVADPSGAPPLQSVFEAQRIVGADPSVDAINVLRYVRAAIDSAQDVHLWQDEDLLPAYLPSEDHFPKPKAQERRYDLVRPGIPRPGRSLGALEELPKTGHFRKMAIYVRSNRVVRVMEEIDIEGHADFVQAKRENKTRMLELLDQVLAAQGLESVRTRTMSVEFTGIGDEVLVRRPEGAINASLSGLFGAEIPLPPASDETEAPPAETPPTPPG